MLVNPLPLPAAAAVAAVMRSNPANPPAPGDRRAARFSTANYPLLPSVLMEVLWLSQYIELDADVLITGILASSGFATPGVVSVTANYTPLPNVSVILAGAGSGALTITLPDATQPGYTPGQRYTIIKTDGTSNAVTVTGSAGQQVGGASSQSLTTGNSVISVVFDGVTTNNWWVWSGITALSSTLLTPTGVKTSAYAASPHDYVVCNIFTSGFTVTLPTTPADGTIIGVQVIGVSGSNVLTVATGGSDVFNKAGGSGTLQLVLLNQSAIFQYSASARIWYGTSNDVPLADLDARYSQTVLTPTSQNTSYSANPGDYVLVDTTSTSPTVTLPSAPADKSVVGVKIYKQPGSNTVTIARGGSDTFDDTSGTSKTLSLLFQSLLFQYDAALTTWVTIAGNLALAQLDARYGQPPMMLLAATTTSGYAKVNGTGTIISYTFPSDSAQHQFLVLASETVASPESGGGIATTHTAPGGGTQTGTNNIFAGAKTSGTYHVSDGAVAEAGSTVSVTQASALTGGASTVWVSLWGS